MTASANILSDVQKAISTRTVSDHRRLVRLVTDLFVVNAPSLGDDDIALFDIVLNELIREIDAAARALLALRLAPVANAPARLMRTLAGDDQTDVACPVLTMSARLDDSTLVETARFKSQDHLFAISLRPSLSRVVTDVLVERGDAQVLISVAGNAGALFSQRGYERLVGRAEGNDGLADRIRQRSDLPPALLAVLIKTASEHVHAELAAELPHAAREIRESVQSAALHVASKHENAARDPGAARALVERLHHDGQLDDARIGSFAEGGGLEEVKVALSLASDLPAAFVDQALAQEGAEMLLVIARATDLSWSTVGAILRLPLWRRPATEGEIRHCLARYEKLSGNTASQIMRFYKARL